MSDEIFIVDESSLRKKIYVVRGVQVMLDFDLAEIYGYETKYFNRQVKNNIERFEGEEFMFRLTADEYSNLRFNFCTSSWGGKRYLPYAFTEQGVYLLMTVLKGELAVRQSRTLVRLFKVMKDQMLYNAGSNELFNNSFALKKLYEHDNSLKVISENMVTKAELSDIMRLFNSGLKDEEILVLDGEPFKADLAYQKIYSKAKKSVMVIDDYIGVKTLQHLVHASANVTFTVISDNKGSRPLRLSEYNDFLSEYPGRSVTFLSSCGRTHDRYIVLDEGTRSMKVYHCGASSKDAGKRITTITRIGDVKEYKGLVKELKGNSGLVLS